MERFQEAWADVDIPALVGLLADDALLTMPPEAMRLEGSEQIGHFFATAPLGGQLDRIRLVPTRANGQPALAVYAQEVDEGDFDAYGVMVFATSAGDGTATSYESPCRRERARTRGRR
jgi:hypothetical protein